jgi:hypothetical protein
MRNSTFSVRNNRKASFGFRSFLGGAPTGFKVMFGIVATIIGLGFGAVIFSGVTHVSQVNAYTNCTVNTVQFAIDEDGFETYRVLSSCGAFTADGNLFYGQVTGSGLASGIVEGDTYNFTATGLNKPNLGLLPNIVEATPVS